MPTRITQINNEESKQTILKVEGSLLLEDAELIAEICRDLQTTGENNIALDLAGLNFLDSESASVLCRLKQKQNIALEGLQLFIKKVVELTEKEN